MSILWIYSGLIALRNSLLPGNIPVAICMYIQTRQNIITWAIPTGQLYPTYSYTYGHVNLIATWLLYSNNLL